ncbi:hypothetical protein FRC02_004942 [Tulasnella sp. 418]|nr:hypothetical protein FRC02_004942 [Tulasnella sp. 418]
MISTLPTGNLQCMHDGLDRLLQPPECVFTTLDPNRLLILYLYLGMQLVRCPGNLVRIPQTWLAIVYFSNVTTIKAVIKHYLKNATLEIVLSSSFVREEANMDLNTAGVTGMPLSGGCWDGY